jgi:Glycosyl hydrolases family 31
MSLTSKISLRIKFILGSLFYAWTWTGDIASTWSALKQTISTVLGLGLSGIPYSGPDIGGFQGNPSPEPYLRWFQICCFLMFCRTHSANNVEDRAPWSYGEPILTILRQFLQLRYRLIPYFYTLSWEASQKGYPPMRPLFWLDPTDSAYTDSGDGYDAFRQDKFRLQSTASGLGLGWESEGEFVWPYRSMEVQVHNRKVNQAWADETVVVVQNNTVKISSQFSLLCIL